MPFDRRVWLECRALTAADYDVTVVDPRTGQILKGNVSLGSLRVRQDIMLGTGLAAGREALLSAAALGAVEGAVEAGRVLRSSGISIEKRAAAILQTDAAVCGGITEFRKIAATRVAAGDGSKVADEVATQIVCAEATATARPGGRPGLGVLTDNHSDRRNRGVQRVEENGRLSCRAGRKRRLCQPRFAPRPSPRSGCR